MDDASVAALDDFWRTISRKEEFICQYGHYGCPDWDDKWHLDLEDAYSRVRPLLNSMTWRRMFHRPPGDLNPFDAENYHHALVKFLNPPERWFGNVGVLHCQGYLAWKRAAEEEESAVAQSSAADAIAEAITSPLDDLSLTEITILKAIDLQMPRYWKEIARRAKCSHDVVRRYSTSLQMAKLIKKVGTRGFVRLVRLPEGCDEV